jgi:BirA family biotin operon repressor/biotin-[acetyl-CoA-carboxylase] ligase
MERNLDGLLFQLIENRTIALSGEKLARDLGLPHSMLVRWIEKLRAAGVEILGEPFTGYRLGRLPDILLPQYIRPRLRTEALGRTLFHLYTIDSTNAFAASLLDEERAAPHGAVIVSEAQTAGRGRLGRSWHSAPETGLYLSVILRPKIPSSVAPLFTLAAAVAMHDVIEEDARVDVDIKWPNDLLVGNRKVCGILSEIRAEVDRVSAMVIGVGVNVNHTEFPEDLADRATSLRLASGRTQSRLEIFVDFLETFERILEAYALSGPSSIVESWTARSSFATGRTLRIDDGFRSVEGVTRGLNRFGALRVETAQGRIEEFYSGDVMQWL